MISHNDLSPDFPAHTISDPAHFIGVNCRVMKISRIIRH